MTHSEPRLYKFAKKRSQDRCRACDGYLSRVDKQEIEAGYHIFNYDCIKKVKGVKKDRFVWGD